MTTAAVSQWENFIIYLILEQNTSHSSKNTANLLPKQLLLTFFNGAVVFASGALQALTLTTHLPPLT